jgi:glutamate-ammonia-ligase adenylyltransferase
MTHSESRGQDCASALRITRALVLERLLCLDCEEQASMVDITGSDD